MDFNFANLANLRSLLSIVVGLPVIYLLGFVIYRLYFHPLAKYPGPFWAKVTGLYTTYHAIFGDRHTDAHKKHLRYGEIVRIGPNTLSFNTKEALKDIYAVNCNVKKGFFYHVISVQFGYPSTFSTTDRVVHASKKRVLAPAFTDAAVHNMEEYVLKHVRTFIDKIGPEEHKKTARRDMGEWANYLTFDVMGDVAFGKDFNMMIKDDNRDVPRLGNAAGHRALIAASSKLVFNLQLDKLFAPKVSTDGIRFKTHVRDTLMERLKSTEVRKDFISFLLKAKEAGRGQPYEFPELIAESRSLMVAGSDTTATQLAANFFYITQNANVHSRLKKEIRSTFTGIEEIRIGEKLDSCEYLKAVVEETLRMNASNPGLLPREVLPGGLNVAGEHIPAGVEVGITPYALHHNPRYFVDPHVHRPERWLPQSTSESSGVGGKLLDENVAELYRAFAPFSQGSRMCIGRRLAYSELWITIARTVFVYDVSYVSGVREETAGPGSTEYKLFDAFASQREGPLLEFRRRT